ncbi:MAG: ATP-binding protein [Clostridia bacterium]
MKNYAIIKEAINNLKEKILINKQKTQSELHAKLAKTDFYKIYAEFKKQELDCAKAQFFKTEFDKKQLNACKKQLDNILNSQNLLWDNLNLKPLCSYCNDLFFIDSKPCKCLKEEMSKILIADSGLKHLHNFEQCNFELYDQNLKSDIKNFYSKMQKWSNGEQQKYKNIIVSGPTGTGKTFLIECMANSLISCGNIVHFSTAFNMNQNLLKFHTTFDENKSKYIDPYLECDYLFIDDLGTEPIFKNVTVEYLTQIISERTLNNKYVIITTNLKIDEIFSRYGERFASRLFNKNISLAVELKNSDLRYKK